jgi:hypothetical protein
MKSVAVTLTCLSLLLLIISGIVEPKFSICSNYISDYVHGQYGRLITIGFYFLGIGGFAFLLGHIRLYKSITLGVILIVLVAIWAFSLGLISAFPVDSGGNTTIFGKIHSVFATTAFSIGLLVILLHSIFTFKGVLSFSFISSVLIVITILLGMLLLVFGSAKYAGIYQRMIIFPEIVWFIIIGLIKSDQVSHLNPKMVISSN